MVLTVANQAEKQEIPENHCCLCAVFNQNASDEENKLQRPFLYSISSFEHLVVLQCDLVKNDGNYYLLQIPQPGIYNVLSRCVVEF